MRRARAVARLESMRAARHPLLLAALAALAGCGFQPLYGKVGQGPAVSEDLAAVKIDFIANRSGQILRNYLLDGMTPRGEPQRSAWTLQVLLNEPRPQELGTASDGSIVRFAFNVRANFRLVEAANGRVAFQGNATSNSSYEVTTSQYASVASRDNARDRVLEDVALDIRNQLAVFFRERREARAAQ